MMSYKIKYSYSKEEFKQRLENKIIRPNIKNKIRIAYSLNGKERVFFGTLNEERFSIYTLPDMTGPFFKKPSEFLRGGMSKWASPTYLYGSISEFDGETVINCRIAKNVIIPVFFLIGFTILGAVVLAFVSRIIYDILHGGLQVKSYIIPFLLIAVLGFLTASCMYIPESERDALLNFIKSI